MDAEDPPQTLFDELIDRSLRGEEIDLERILAAHPSLSDEERRQLRTLCGESVVTEGEPTSERAGPLAPTAGLPFSRIGDHRLIRRIGAGAMGAVFLADDEALGRQVAIKVLGPDILGTGERADRFLREVRAAARLRHPNIVGVHSAGEQDGFRYMVMEFVPGSSLQEVMAEAAAKGSRPARRDVLRWGTEIANALQAAHQAGIAHRDVKPSNIRITPEGRAVLLDFGLAREAGDATLTETGAFRGSPQYASPEQVDPGGRAIDARTDIYSLGAALYELLTGLAPFRGETREQLFNDILTREPVPPRRLDPSIPRDLDTVVLAALDKDPARRPQSAAALAADLEAVRDGRPVSVRPPSAIGRLVRWTRRHPARAGLAVVIAIAVPAIAGLGGYIAANRSKISSAEAAERAQRQASLLEDAYLEYGEGDPSRAEAIFVEALRLQPGSVEAQAGLALARLEIDPTRALTFLDGLAQVPESAWQSRIRHAALVTLGKQDDASSLGSKGTPPSTAVDLFVAGLMELKEFEHTHSKKRANEAFAHLREAVWGMPAASMLHHSELGHAAWHADRAADARAIAASIGRLWVDSPEKWFAIGRTLTGADHEAALDALEKAASPPPRAVAAREFIVLGLLESGRGDAVSGRALALARDTVLGAPDRAKSHAILGYTLVMTHDYPAGIREYREAIRLKPDYALAHRKLGTALAASGDLAGAISSAREAVRLDANEYLAWNVLGVALLSQGDAEEAARAFEKVLERDPDDAEALCNLGSALLRLGEFSTGLERLRAGHDKGSTSPKWQYSSKKWVAQAERLVALEKRLEQVRRGEGEPPTPEERLKLAREVCGPKKRFAEAASLYSEAFAADPTLTAQRDPDYLVEAVRAAVSAGLGKGGGAPARAAEKTEILAHARAWLEDDIRDAEQSPGSSAAATPRPWMTDPLVAAMRTSAGLDGMAAAEADAWRALWKRCDALLARHPESAASRVTK